MLGKDPEEVAALERRGTDAHHAEASENKVLEATNLGRKGAVEPFDLDVHAGEVVGFAGLLGSGRTEAVRLLFGLDRATSGSLAIDGQADDKTDTTPGDRSRNRLLS